MNLTDSWECKIIENIFPTPIFPSLGSLVVQMLVAGVKPAPSFLQCGADMFP